MLGNCYGIYRLLSNFTTKLDRPQTKVALSFISSLLMCLILVLEPPRRETGSVCRGSKHRCAETLPMAYESQVWIITVELSGESEGLVLPLGCVGCGPFVRYVLYHFSSVVRCVAAGAGALYILEFLCPVSVGGSFVSVWWPWEVWCLLAGICGGELHLWVFSVSISLTGGCGGLLLWLFTCWGPYLHDIAYVRTRSAFRPWFSFPFRLLCEM